jgi:two-component system sensor kinase FixL
MPDSDKSQPPEAERYNQLDSLMDAMIDALIVIDEKGVIERINSSAENMFGYTCTELTGKNISELMAGRDKKNHGKYLTNYQKTGKAKIIGIGREVVAQRKDGDIFPADIAVGEVRGPAGVRYIGLVRDLSAERAAQTQMFKQRQEMLNTSRLSTMGEMAAAMAHELNQPLSAISNYAAACRRLLEADDVNKASITDALERISTQAQRAAEVIRRTRDFTRAPDAKRATTTIADLLDDIVPMAQMDAHANNIALHLDVPKTLSPIYVDELQVQQVLLNLLRNSVDAMQDCPPEHRNISLSARYTAPGEISLVVSDEGSGISDEVAKKLFNPFVTTKNSGMGMGLAISRTIAEAHGGSLEFRRNPKRGVSFVLTLPTQASR